MDDSDKPEVLGRRTGIRLGLLDRIACWVGIWALRRLYGECETDVRDDFPDQPDLRCVGCEATRMIHEMRELFDDAKP